MTIESQLNSDSEILIEKPELILKLFELMKVTQKRTLADIFAFYFMYFKKELFIVYSFDEHEGGINGSKKSRQRWEQCVDMLNIYYGPAVEAIYAVRYFNKKVQDSTKELVKEVVQDLIAEVNKINFTDEVKQDLVEKLNAIKYVIGYPEEILDLRKIEEFYNELNLNGTEGIVESFLKIGGYDWKILNNLKSNWKKKLIELIYTDNIKYYSDDNILCEYKYECE